MHDDKIAVAEALAGKPGAFDALIKNHQRLCWDIVFRLVRHPEDARDLCQETFIRVHRSLPGYRFESTLRTWIGRIAYNVAMNHLQRRRVPTISLTHDNSVTLPTEDVADNIDIEAFASGRERALRLHAAIDALPPLQRTLLLLYYMDECSISDIAEITGLPQGTVKSHLYRTRLNLRATLERSLGEIP
jgi:RNA polymerase sigma factor (sigma-70 family)